jgi:glutathione S-transferase
MIKLFGFGPSRWVRPYWTARELGLAFDPVTLSFARGEHRSPEHLARQPFGKTPALEDGAFTLFESAAICTYLADQRPDAGLVPAPRTQARAKHDQWMSFVISDLEQPLWRITRHRLLYPEGKRSAAEIELAKDDFRGYAATLEGCLTDHLVGDRFSVADILMTYTLKWSTLERVVGEDLLVDFARLRAYVALHQARPAFPVELYA